MSRTPPFALLVASTGLVAACNMVYELALAQSLATLFGNSVLRYSLTIGLYLVALGAGAMWWATRTTREPGKALFKLEVILVAVGGFGPLVVFAIEGLLESGGVRSPWPGLVLTHAAVIAIGWLSGIEIPILLDLAAARGWGDVRGRIIAMDFVGACVGALLFPLLLFPYAGLLAAAFIASFGNLLAAALAWRFAETAPSRTWSAAAGAMAALLIAATLCEGMLRDQIGRWLF